jgi:hypothetical protein
LQGTGARPFKQHRLENKSASIHAGNRCVLIISTLFQPCPTYPAGAAPGDSQTSHPKTTLSRPAINRNLHWSVFEAEKERCHYDQIHPLTQEPGKYNLGTPEKANCSLNANSAIKRRESRSLAWLYRDQ